jgi:5-hydroxyisourate hydrolase-like protein (transthyretin family)
MADNVAITAGSGTTVGTDEVTIAATAVQVQLVKILDATDASTNRLVVDSSGRVTTVTVNPSGTATRSTVNLAVTSFTILASNASRKWFQLYNDSVNVLYVDLSGGTVTTSNYTFQMAPGAYWESSEAAVFTNVITGISAVASGAVKVCEVA